MTPRKPRDPDAITLEEAAALLGLTPFRVTRLRREGLLVRLEGHPTYSRSDVQEYLENPWLTGVQAAIILGVSHARVSQLAAAERIPAHVLPSGRRVYRQRQLEVVARARSLRRDGGVPGADVVGADPDARSRHAGVVDGHQDV